MWKRLDFIALQSDEDGCLVVMTRNDYDLAAVDLLSAFQYIKTPDLDGTLCENLCMCYKTLCHLLCMKLGSEYPGLFYALTRDLRHRRYTDAVAKLTATVKFHKPHGEVVLRALHSSSMSPFAPGMRYLRDRVRARMSHLALSHILRDSSDLVSKLANIIVTNNDIMMKIDI